MKPVPLKVKLDGRYELYARKPATGDIRELAEFDNLILDSGLDRLGVIPSGEKAWNAACQVGAGNSTPIVSQTTLDSFVAGTTTQSSSYSNSGTPDYITKRTITYTFGVGVAAGNLSEVGIGCSDEGTYADGPLFSRALILDSEGDPTTITVLSDEELIVKYILTITPNLADVVFTQNISGIDYECTLRVADVDDTSDWGPMRGRTTVSPGSGTSITIRENPIAIITGDPGTPSSGKTPSSVASYIDGTYFRDFKGDWLAGDGNYAGGIKSCTLQTPVGFWQMGFDPPVPKTSEYIFSLTFRVHWARAA